MRARAVLSIVCLSSLAVLAACGEDETIDSTGTPDVTFNEVSFFDTAPAVDTTFTGTLPPDFGQPCRDNRDCTTGWCVEGPDGYVCSKSCIEDCPADWGCKGVTSGSVDLVFLCVPDGEPPGPDVIEPDTTSPPDTFEPADTTPPADTGPMPDTTPPTDTTQPPVGTLCDLDPGVGTDSFFTESSDWPDCVNGCPYPADLGLVEIDLGGPGNQGGALGVLDGAMHTYSVGLGPDIDVIALRAQPRTMIEIAVQAGVGGSLIDPLVYISDGFQVRTYNSDVSPTNACARTTIAFPYVAAAPLYLVIEDAINYSAWTPTGYGPTVGGSSYGYTVRIKTTPFAPIDLGSTFAGGTLAAPNQTLLLGGETRYYRFTAPANATPTVTLTRTGGADFVPAVGVFKSDQGQMVWQSASHDGDGDGVVAVTGGFIPCHGACGSEPAEFYFAVYDWNGAAGPGTFSYNLNIQVN